MHHEILTTIYPLATNLLYHLSPLKDAFHLLKTLLISSRNLSPGLATVDVLSVTVPPGVQHHFKHVSVNFFQTRDIVRGIL